MSAKLLEKPTSKVAASVVDTPAFKTWFRGSKVVNTQGQPLVVYHGTTHEFDRFDVSKFSKEGAYGQALYFTSSGQDAGSNYATPDGPDITNRVEQLAETIFYDLPEVHENEPKRGSPEYLAAQEKAKAQARKELVGEHGGVVYLLFLRIQNPVVVKPSGGTYFEDPNRFLRAYRRAAESFHVDADLLLLVFHGCLASRCWGWKSKTKSEAVPLPLFSHLFASPWFWFWLLHRLLLARLANITSTFVTLFLPTTELPSPCLVRVLLAWL